MMLAAVTPQASSTKNHHTPPPGLAFGEPDDSLQRISDGWHHARGRPFPAVDGSIFIKSSRCHRADLNQSQQMADDVTGVSPNS